MKEKKKKIFQLVRMCNDAVILNKILTFCAVWMDKVEDYYGKSK